MYIYMFIYFGFQLLWILNIYANSEIISFYWIILKSNMNIEQKHFISSWRKKGTRAFLLDMNWLSMLNQYMKKRIYITSESKKPGQILVVIHYRDLFRFFCDSDVTRCWRYFLHFSVITIFIFHTHNFSKISTKVCS